MKHLRIYIILFLVAAFSSATKAVATITIEAASSDPTLIVRGNEHAISGVNQASWESLEGITLFTSSFGSRLASSNMTYTAIQVDDKMRVTKVVNGAPSKGIKPTFIESVNLDIPQGGFVLVAIDDNYTSKYIKRFVAEEFHVGDIIKLRFNGEVTSVKFIESQFASSLSPAIQLIGETMRTISTNNPIMGQITSFSPNKKLSLLLKNGDEWHKIKTDKKGNFSHLPHYKLGTNYISLQLSENSKIIDQKEVICYVKENNNEDKEIVLWVEQFPNAKKLLNDKAVEEVMLNAKEAGFTSIGIDVKGPEGFVSYRKNTLSQSPYITELQNPNKQVVENGFDLLESFVTLGHKHGLKIYASFNFFTEGNLTTGDYAVLRQHPNWEEVVQRPEDKGRITRLSESKVGQEAKSGKRLALAFVNPSNKDVQNFQLLRVKEVLMNYDVDGIVLDRCRYDNYYADFGEISKQAFAQFLTSRGKHLNDFPEDAFVIDNEGKMIKGQFFNEWILFRSLTIKEFTDRVRSMVDEFKIKKNSQLQLAAYVGSWFEVYYQNGVNWSSKNFVYDTRLNFPESQIYTQDYGSASYLNNLDFLMIGTYYKTEQEVKKYITLGNILTNGELPLIGSMSMPDLKENEQEEVFEASLQESSGLMIFDLCYINWETFIAKLNQAKKSTIKQQ